MKRLFYVVLTVLMAVFCCACAQLESVIPEGSAGLPVSPEIPENPGATADFRAYLPCNYYDEALVRAQIDAASPSDAYQNIAGAVVPHYAPAMYMAADLLASVADAPETVVIIAPNHAGKGPAIQICGNGYYWKSGSLQGNPELAAQLAAALDVETDDSAAQEDWSASLLVPYLAHYFPETRVVTVLLTRGTGDTALRLLAGTLAGAAQQQSLLVLGSADFSHYQDEQTARACDAETARILSEGDTARLLTLSNAYLDSPETISVLLTYASLLEQEFCRADGLFETFLQDGRRIAGSYYSYVII